MFLNHGSYGATPREVLAVQNRFRARMEAEPVKFFVIDLPGLMDEARRETAEFLRCRAGDVALIPNATQGVATVMLNVVLGGRLTRGDEILVNDHEYPACLNTMRFWAGRVGAQVVSAKLPWPVPETRGPEAVAEAILAGVTDRTRVVLLSHITSSSGMIMPVELISRGLERRLREGSIELLVDGAHAPGMLPELDLSVMERLGVTYYTANCHKWVCSPKGSAVLWVTPARQEGFRPLALSNRAETGVPGRAQYLTEFDFLGTADPSAVLTIGAAVRFMGGLLPGGWAALARHNRELTIAARRRILQVLGTEACVPESMMGSLATMLIPRHEPARAARLAARKGMYADVLQDRLLERHGVQLPVWGVQGDTWPDGTPRRALRIAAQIYNSMEQFEYFAGVLAEELEQERRE